MRPSFALRLRYYRAEAGLTQQQLSDLSGVSRKQISDYEKEIQKNPRESTVVKLAKALNINTKDLLPEINYPSFEEFSKIPRTNEVVLNLPAKVISEIEQMAEDSGRSFDDELDYFMNNLLIDHFDSLKNKQH